jgi:hypothetical protein
MNSPTAREECNQLFCFPGLLDPKAGMVYTDFAGKFPMRSIDGNTLLFIKYDWTTNCILATPVIDTKETTIVDTFKNNIGYLEN